MADYTRLPKSLPESLRYKRPDPSPVVKARTHHKKAEKLRDEERAREKLGEVDPSTPHLQFLERMKALEAAIEDKAELAKKEYRGKLAKDSMGPHELLGHVIAGLPQPRLKLIFSDERIGQLNALVMKPGRRIQQVIAENEALADLGITFLDFRDKKRDLKFALGLQGYKSAQALGLYFVVLQKAADPKVRKKRNLVQDKELLDVANGILREVATHIIEEMQIEKQNFLDVGQRRKVAVDAKGAKLMSRGAKKA